MAVRQDAHASSSIEWYRKPDIAALNNNIHYAHGCHSLSRTPTHIMAFFDLPRELRDEIYGYFFLEPYG